MNDNVRLYWSEAGDTKGWWLASYRLGPDRLRIVKVLRNTQRDATPEAVIEAAAQVLPEVHTWHRATDASGRVIGWTGERDEVMA